MNFYYIGLFLDYEPTTRQGNNHHYFEVRPYQFWEVCKKAETAVSRIYTKDNGIDKGVDFVLDFAPLPLDSKIREIILKAMNS